jgi:FlaA1/EpsC-like NDP-sugar epimerase
LAEKLIRLSGYTPYEDIKIEFTGLRPGEKLYEELTLSEEEGEMQLTANNKIFVLPPVQFDSKKLEQGLKALRHVNEDNVRDLLRDLVPNYHEAER